MTEYVYVPRDIGCNRKPIYVDGKYSHSIVDVEKYGLTFTDIRDLFDHLVKVQNRDYDEMVLRPVGPDHHMGNTVMVLMSAPPTEMGGILIGFIKRKGE